MIKRTPVAWAYLLFAIPLVAIVVISHNVSRANDTSPTGDGATIDTPITVPSSIPTRLKTATPTPTNSATPTRCSTPVPDDQLPPPDDERLGRPYLEYAELGMRSEIGVETVVIEEDVRPSTPTPSRSMQPTPLPNTAQPPILIGKALAVDQDAQVLRVYEDGIEIRILPVSTGVPPLYTPAFLGHVGRYVSTIYGYGERADNAWYVFTAGGDIYVHSVPYTLSEEVKIYKGLEFLGVRPSSHGCIRLHPADAEWLTAWNPRGVPILITPLDLSKEW